MFDTHRKAGLVMIAVLALAPSQAPTRAASSSTATAVAGAPRISIAGGSDAQRATVMTAVARFVEVGLVLPDLEVRIHDGNPGCGGMQGLFHRRDRVGVIDLCYPGEFLALHELGHAWETFNLTESERDRFRALTGSPSWRSPDVVWRRRGAEQAANAIANGLLSVKLSRPDDLRARAFLEFEALTEIASPRLAEMVPATDPVPAQSSAAVDRLRSYAEWRSAQP